MTMEASTESFEFIADNIFRKRSVVSYRQVSRSLGIHQSQAKKVLYEFYQKNRDKLDGSFVISGRNASGTLVKFSENEQDIEDDVRLFDNVNTIQIYSISLKELNVTIDTLAQEESKLRVNHDEIDVYVKNGMIKGPELKVVDIQQPERSRPATSTRAPTETVSSLKTENAKPVKSPGLTSGYVSRKQGANASRANTISGYVSRKSEVAVIPAKRSLTDPKPKYEYKSRKQEKAQSKERVVISSYEPHNEPEEIQSKPPPAKTTELENLFADDFSDEDTTMMEADDNNEPIAVSSEEKEKEPLEVEKMEDVQDEDDVEMQEKEPSTEPEPQPQQVEDEEDDQGKVHTKESVTDGGSVTFTSYRKKSTPKPETKRPPARSNTAERKSEAKKTDNKKADGKKKQSSLMSFFQKN